MTHAHFMNTLCRGIVGYVSYNATCDLSPVYSEYMLYEPIARIAKGQGYSVSCEYPAANQTSGPGDKKRIDFKFTKSGESILVEVKWVRTKTATIAGDLEKLRSTDAEQKYLLIFGEEKVVDAFTGDQGTKLPPAKNSGKVVNWNTGKTHYAARWYREERTA